MPSVVSEKSITKAGIITSSSGERHIPSSKRADGTLRKEIKVRPGYRPPEDVEVYKNKTADSWKSRGKGGVPGAEYTDPKAKAPASKPKVKKETSKEASLQTVLESLPKQNLEKEQPAEPVDPEAEKEKEARKLSKKLRQARELQQKNEEGQASLLPEQFDKIIKINELIRQLDKLGFDAEGQRKIS